MIIQLRWRVEEFETGLYSPTQSKFVDFFQNNFFFFLI